jgi:gamma-glutamylcyclotransferase (GGCT)/AIG2-like uncharacterized protein YtfP
MSLLVFVYGTLKRGLHNAHYLAGQKFISEARTQPLYRMVDCGGYPGMYRVTESGLTIHGEIWDISEECLAKLDLLEDVAGGEYERIVVQLLPPYADLGVQGYLYCWRNPTQRDAGDNWGDTSITRSGLAAREKSEQT